MEPLVRPKRRRQEIQLLMTPMVDIFTILVIFIIKGSVFSQTQVTIPDQVRVPLSKNNEGLDDTLKVTVFGDQIRLHDEVFPIAIVSQNNAFHPRRSALLEKLHAHFDKWLKQGLPQASTVQLIADRRTPYALIYETSEFLRIAGASRVILVTEARED